MMENEKRSKIIETDDFGRQLSTLERLWAERQYLKSKLQNAHTWIPLLHLKRPDLNAEEVMQGLRSRLSEIRQQEVDIQKKHRPAKHRYTFPQHPYRRPDFSGVSAYAGLISAQQQQDCPGQISGSVHYPTDFRLYMWGLPDSYGEIDWTYVRRPTRRERQQGQTDWHEVRPITEADAIAFKAHLGPTISFDMMSAVLCLKYTFPVTQCDSVLEWRASPRAVLPSGLDIDADEGFIVFTIVLHEQPQAGLFPDFRLFEWTERHYFQDDFNHESARKWDLTGAFDIQARIQSALYIGLAVQMAVDDGGNFGGLICTGDCATRQDRDYWHKGLFQVYYDLGFNMPVVGTHGWGVGYDILPR